MLALENLAATIGNHAAVIEDGGLQAMFALSNAADDLSQYYVAYALANLSSNPSNHERIVEEGGLQPLIALAYVPCWLLGAVTTCHHPPPTLLCAAHSDDTSQATA